MDIKAGEYVRTDKGDIVKVDKEKKILSIIGFLDVEYGKIKSHSENLIDLIEVGDIVNNHLVLAKWEFPQEIMIENEDEIKCRSYLKSSQIKTILTKEQYERNCYKAEE